MVIFSIFFNIKVCYVNSLESPRQGDSNEYTQNTIFNKKKKKKKEITLNCRKSAARTFFSKGHKNEFKIAVLNEPPGFEPLKVYSTCKVFLTCTISISDLKWQI